MTDEIKGLRAELIHLWKQFVVQCESIEEGETGSPADINMAGMSERETIRAEGYLDGLKFAAKSIRRSVPSPRYDMDTYPFFHRKPLSEQFRNRAVNTRADAQVYRVKEVAESRQSSAYVQMMHLAAMWDEAAKMAEENGD